MAKARLFFWLIFLMVWNLCAAQEVVQIRDSTDEVNFMPYQLSYYVDTTNLLTFDEVSSPLFSGNFRQHSSYQNIDFKVNKAYWIRLPIHHNPGTRKIWLLEFYDQTVDYIEAYIPQVNGGYNRVQLGDQQPFVKRLLRHKNFEIILNMPTDTVMTYYFLVRSHEFADIRIALRSIDRFVYYALNEYLLFGTFYGMILIIALYNFLVFLAMREIKNIYYICYILSVAAYAMSLDGIGFQYLWPNLPEWNNYAVGIFLYSLILWALIFTRKFLSTRANDKHRFEKGSGSSTVICSRFGRLSYAAS